jgi:hypothetical protein
MSFSLLTGLSNTIEYAIVTCHTGIFVYCWNEGHDKDSEITTELQDSFTLSLVIKMCYAEDGVVSRNGRFG